MRSFRRFSIGLGAALIIGGAAMAQPTSTGSISLQGRLTGVADGTRQLTFFLHDAESGGNQVASVGPIATAVSAGAFAANIAIPPSTFDGRTLWWSVAVDGGAATARQLVTSVPYAATAGRLASSEPELVLSAQSVRCDGGLTVSTPAGGSYDPVSVFHDGQRLFTVAQGGQTTLRSLQIDGNGGSQDPLAVYQSAQARFFVGASGVTTNVGLLFTQGASTNNYALDVTNTGAGGLRVTTNPGGGLDPVAVFHAGQRLFTVLQGGTTQVRTLQILGGADLAEAFPAAPATSQAVEPEPGMVLSIDPDNPGALRVATEAYDSRVAGVYSGGNGLPTGMVMGKEGCDLTAPDEDKLPLAMTGRVWVYADESNGAIQPGDRLTTSGTKPGHAMRATDKSRTDGAVIGKAMTRVDAASGMVLVLVNVQ